MASCKVLIPTVLRPQVGQVPSLELDGDNVGDVLGRLREQFPELGRRLYRDDSQLNRFINVFLNDEDIRFLEDLKTPIAEGDELSLVPAVAGG